MNLFFRNGIIQHVENKARKLGHPQLFILVIACAEKLKSFYKKMGFHFTGKAIQREPNFIENVNDLYKTQVHFLEMGKELRLQSKL